MEPVGKLLLYGGTFDPPHQGHMNNLRAVMEAVHPDKVLVMPAGIPPHKAASATSAELRLAMCRCFTEVDPRVEVSRWEIDREGRSYTVHTLQMLRDTYPGTALYLALGSDMLLSFTKWHRWQAILALATLVVQSRAGGDSADLHAAADALRPYGGRVLFAHAVPVPCASSQIRAGTLEPDTLRQVLPGSVRRIIRQKNLYGLADRV